MQARVESLAIILGAGYIWDACQRSAQGGDKGAARATPIGRGIMLTVNLGPRVSAEMSDLPARDGHVIHAKAAQRTKRLFVPASSRFKGCQLSSGIRAGVDAQRRERSGQREVGVGGRPAQV